MGHDSRQRRAAKQRRRAKRTAGRSGTAAPDERWTPGADGDPYRLHAGLAADLALSALIRARSRQPTSPLARGDVFGAHPPRLQADALDKQLLNVLELLFGWGWTPNDLAEVARRKLTAPAAGYLLDAAAFVTDSLGDVDARWQAQLDALGARATASGPAALAWAADLGMAWPDAAEQLLATLVVAYSLPEVQPLIPAPGAVGASVAPPSSIDEKVLRRVRGLLAKAESTEHDAEAEALTEKAQSLMTQYSIERALAEQPDADRPPSPSVRRLWLDNPYPAAKSLLVSAVADANHGRAVFSERWGFVTLIGFAPDLDVIELLTTSLLVQAGRAMATAKRSAGQAGGSRTRSFRQSFLVAYAGRIGERLAGSATPAEATADVAPDGRLLPVLAARDREVDDALGAAFPQLRERAVTVTNAAGWGAGRAAADLALFDIRDMVGGT